MRLQLAGLSVFLLAIGVFPGCHDSRVRQPPEAGSYRIVTIGDTTEGVLSRLDEDVFALQPNIIILGIGTNDAGYEKIAALVYATLRADAAKVE